MDYLCQSTSIFKNPYKTPLNELYLENKWFKRCKRISKEADLNKDSKELYKYYDIRVEKIAALDPSWVPEKCSYHEYQPYYSEVSKEENELFIEKNKLFLESLSYILERSYHQFWCLMLFEPRVRKILNSFIENPMSWFEIKHLEEEYLRLYSDICDSVANIYGRLLTFKQCDTEHMSEDTVVRYLEEYQLITYPKIVHLCLLYSNTNRKLIDNITNIFFSSKRKSHYSKELKKLMAHTLSVFDTLGGEVCGYEDNVKLLPNYIRKKPAKFDPFWVEEATSYLLDTAANLNAFLSVCKAAVETAVEMGIPFRLSYFYNRVYHEFYTIMKITHNLPFEWKNVENRIYDQLALGRSEFVAVFHIFVTNCIDNIVQHVGSENQGEYVEQYLKLISSALEDEFFIFDYQNTNEIDIQIQMIGDFHPDLDHTRTNYILECLSTLPNFKDLQKANNETAPSPPKVIPSTSRQPPQNPVPVIKKPNQDEIQSLICSVLDTLPHLGDGFVLKCLEHYDYDTSEVISAILDQNLPPHILEIPPDQINVPPEPKPKQPVIAYRGKKPGYSDAIDLLNDKSEIQATKDFVLKKSTISYDVYDDEYDDRDEIETSHRYPDRDDEPDLYKYMENRFDGYDLVSDISESSADEDDSPSQSKSKTQNGDSRYNGVNSRQPKEAFCEDPALIRERREAQRRQNYSTKPKNFDVVGKPKGQGQDTSVKQNREKKNTNKSTKGNHNRKGGAQWKRNKGMLPS